MNHRGDRRSSRRSLPTWPILLIGVALVAAGCAGGATASPGWTFGPTLASGSPSGTASTPSAVPSSAVVAPSPSGGTPKPFSGEMTPHVLLVDGYVTMYMELVNTGNEPLTFLNTLYDTEPTRLYSPTVVYPWASGEPAVTTRAGRFFPSPSIVQPGDRAVYILGGMPAKGSGELAAPVANIKYCPTRGMDDIPSVPVEVRDVTWSAADGVTTVKGALVETEGSRRVNAPVVGVAFFDRAGAFVGAVVDSRVGDRLDPRSSRPFSIEGRGVDTSRIFRAEAYAYVS